MESKGYLIIAGWILVIMGLIGSIISIISGQVMVYLILVIPVFVLNGIIPLISILFLFGGSSILFIGRILSVSQSSGVDLEGSETGGVVFIGPVPVLFGSFRKMFKRSALMRLLILSVVVVLTAVFLISMFFSS